MKLHETILDLIVKADRGNRIIDGEIAKFLGWHRITPSDAKQNGYRLRDGGWIPPGDHVAGKISWDGEIHRICPAFSTSRDALKSIRPGNWQNVTVNRYNNSCDAYISNGMIKRESPRYMPTEELAELHAIIQAIAYERGL